jgi:hypothetical protein
MPSMQERALNILVGQQKQCIDVIVVNLLVVGLHMIQ